MLFLFNIQLHKFVLSPLYIFMKVVSLKVLMNIVKKNKKQHTTIVKKVKNILRKYNIDQKAYFQTFNGNQIHKLIITLIINFYR